MSLFSYSSRAESCFLIKFSLFQTGLSGIYVEKEKGEQDVQPGTTKETAWADYSANLARQALLQALMLISGTQTRCCRLDSYI